MHRQISHRFKLLLITLLVLSGSFAAHAACQVEGPSLDETVRYLVAAGKTIVPNYSLSYNIASGTIQLDSGFHQTVSAYLLDCSNYLIGGHPATVVKVWCKENALCVNTQQKSGEPFNEPSLHMYYEADDDHAMRVARALSHFIYLVQTQHDEVQDPFSAKH